MADLSIRLRPVIEDDLAMFRRFATDSYLGAEDGRLVVEVEQDNEAAGFVSFRWAAGRARPGREGDHAELR